MFHKLIIIENPVLYVYLCTDATTKFRKCKKKIKYSIPPT